MWTRRLVRAFLAIIACSSMATHSSAQDRPAPDRAKSLIENLRSKDVDVRRDAAARVHLSDRKVQHEALPVLIDLLMKEKDGQVRLAVLDTVTAWAPTPHRPSRRLSIRCGPITGDRARKSRTRIIVPPWRWRPWASPRSTGLRGLLKERKESVRAECIMGLGRIGPDAEAAVPDLIPLLGDKSDRIRREAALALGRIGPAAVAPLIAAADDKDAVVRAVPCVDSVICPRRRIKFIRRSSNVRMTPSRKSGRRP